MKNRIAWKLTVYFAVTLLLFAVVIGGVFSSLFKSHTIDLYKSDMEKRAVAIATSLSEYMSGSGFGPMMMGKASGIGTYLQNLDEIAMSDVWIVDKNLSLYMIGHMADANVQYADLPADLDSLISQVFEGDITFSQGFSDLLESPTLTVGAPISANGTVIGAILLHAPVEGMDNAVSQGFRILALSIVAALVIAIGMSILLAYTFTRPLNKMKRTAMALAEGNYDQKTEVGQSDEIGDLAKAIDTLSQQLAAASRESEKLEALRQDFVSNVSHELRTPVTVIRGSLEALCENVVTDEEQIREYHRQMLKESILLQGLVNELLDLSRLQNTDFQMNMDELNVVDVVEDAIRSASHLYPKKAVTIRTKIDTSKRWVNGDYGRLRQLMLILLDNAVKFSHEGDSVDVELKEDILTITDHGKGIAEQDLPYVFDRFYKVDSEENKTGTGLGLAIAKQIAARHDFSLSVTSEPGETVFILSFRSLASR
ncbi:MAG: two-component sensor histidine kinase [Firmicutes bacterium HGW-Firmicutes-11]|jgi:signal transduction histidine kinase|nr:MAG: two-component sensor histidine kinase [Firmicutes bacterium HGW-Firmicutes-11]